MIAREKETLLAVQENAISKTPFIGALKNIQRKGWLTALLHRVPQGPQF